MKKALIISTVSRQFTLFERGNIEVLKELGYEVHGAANYEDATPLLDELDIRQHHIDIQRNPFSSDNIKAYRQLLKLIRKEKFDLVHCHAPVGGVIGRLASKRGGIKKILYTAHGFHFFKGSSFINWMLFYPVEKYCARFTDLLITINEEDYKRSQNFKAGRVEYIPGIGIDTGKFSGVVIDKSAKRKELGVPDNAFLVLSVGELNKNKNHETVIKAIAKINNPNIHYMICGRGALEERLKDLINKLGLEKRVKLLGYRCDITEIGKVSDAFLFPSFREGLSVALMEAMALGLPVICSRTRGNVDLIEEGNGGYLHDPEDYFSIAKNIDKLIEDKKLRTKMGIYNRVEIKKYDKQIVKEQMKKLYKTL